MIYRNLLWQYGTELLSVALAKVTAMQATFAL